ncbi:hypothetical protein CVIRNUC_007666 [Coccomyxa viridis]|uniref:Uncharacterized protein n=1 Tax=Coccomyxa viridis TaxID=1274662 RepID=A0AAV1ICL1_9CHLO|nr:hypothetical protein CVIRNUC_007666 [Coccomyxa viridis]
MSSVWASDDVSVWQDHLAQVGKRLQALGNVKLEELERWFFDELPVAIAARSPKHLTSEELVRIVDWKLTRGKWRPKLLDYAKSHSETTVRAATSAAFDIISSTQSAQADLKAAMGSLTELKGIGPATASAILTAMSPHVPFMSDEAMAAALKGKKEYTLPYFLKYAAAVEEKASSLSTEGCMFTPKDVERALWSEAAQQLKPRKVSGTSQHTEPDKTLGTKRKR